MYKLIEYLSENLYSSIVIMTIIALIVFFIVGYIKKKENDNIIKHEIDKKLEGTIMTKKKFMQGEIIEKQNLSINKTKEAIVLCAGKGTRMNSDLPKGAVLLKNKPMVLYTVDALIKSGFKKIVVVIGYKKEIIIDLLKDYKEVKFSIQKELNGTGKAVESAENEFINDDNDCLILPCDMPLISSESIDELYNYHYLNHNDLTVLSSIIDNPYSYGRILRNENNEFLKIKEEIECNESEKMVKEVNSSVYLANSKLLFEAIKKIDNNNNKKEYYLTDIVEIFKNMNKKVEAYILKDSIEISGINDVNALLKIENELNSRNK